MNYKLSNGKSIRINDTDLERNMRILKISKDEAIQMYLEDEGYLDNEEQNALEVKAKENRITATIHQAKAEAPKQKTQRERVLKEDTTKERIIRDIKTLLEGLGCTDVTIANPTKLITFNLGGDNFKLDLIRTRKPKEK